MMYENKIINETFGQPGKDNVTFSKITFNIVN